MSLPRSSLWSAVIWMLNGALLVTWLSGAFVAWERDGAGKGLAALLIPPYGLFVAYTEFTSESVPAAGAGRWANPEFAGQVEQLRTGCLANETYRQAFDLTDKQFQEFCLCLSRATFDLLTPREVEFQQRTGAMSDRFLGKRRNARISCLNSSRYIDPSQTASGGGGEE